MVQKTRTQALNVINIRCSPKAQLAKVEFSPSIVFYSIVVSDQTSLVQENLEQHPWHLLHHAPESRQQGARSVVEVRIPSLLDTPMPKQFAWCTRVVFIHLNVLHEAWSTCGPHVVVVFLSCAPFLLLFLFF